ncbi:hypothetical protein ACK4DN_13010, partial [Enterococcus faecium]|uniref:hypothetical protein n=1 Tax=Enterococcus faecium TaxID=1352 RepID=UPI00391968AD
IIGNPSLNHRYRKGFYSLFKTLQQNRIYIIHYPVVVWVCYLLYSYLNLPMIFIYILALGLELILTPLIYELFKRIPVVRFLVLGIKK